jgi:hypothetical protein
LVRYKLTAAIILISAMPISLSTAREQRSKDQSFLKRFMLMTFWGSALVHGIAIATVYLKPTISQLPPLEEPEQEIVIEEFDELETPELPEELPLSEPEEASGSRAKDEPLQVATLPPEPPIAEPEAPPVMPEISDRDVQEQPDPIPSPQPSSQPNASSQPLSSEAATFKNPGLEAQANGNGGDKTGQGTDTGNSQGRGNSTQPSTSSQPVVTQPKPSQPLESVPTRQKPARPKSRPTYDGITYDRSGNNRVLAGYRPRIMPVYDDKGRLIDIRQVRSSGDPELDAAFDSAKGQLIEKLRRQLEARPAELRNRPIRFKFEDKDLNAAERQQAERNRAITESLDRQWQAEKRRSTPTESTPATARQEEPATPLGGQIPLPITVPAIAPAQTAPAPSPAAEPTPAPAEKPTSDSAAEPAPEPEPVVEPVSEPVAEPAPEPIPEVPAAEVPSESDPTTEPTL